MKHIAAILALASIAGIALAADLTPASKETLLVQTAQAVTNGQAVTIGSGLTVLTTAGSADTYTNTITLAAPLQAGKFAILKVAASQSNLVGIADSGTVVLSAAAALGSDDTLTLVSVSTGVWAQVSTSAN